MSSIPAGQRFWLYREEDESGVSGVGFVAVGVQWPSGKCSLEWLTAPSSQGTYDSIEDIERIHGHNGKTKVLWNVQDAVASGELVPEDGKEGVYRHTATVLPPGYPHQFHTPQEEEEWKHRHDHIPGFPEHPHPHGLDVHLNMNGLAGEGKDTGHNVVDVPGASPAIVGPPDEGSL